MITNQVGSQPSYHQVSIERQKEDNSEARKVFEKEAPIENNSNTTNELKRTETVNETNITEQTDNLNKNQEINKEVVNEREKIQTGKISADSALGQNIDITV
jgi:hypothetical protein